MPFGRLDSTKKAFPAHIPRAAAEAGFTLVELIMVIVITGILGLVIAPRLINTNVFQSRGFADQVQSSLRYAQKQAIAQRRNVCVTMTASKVTLTIANASGAAIACGPNLNLPSGVNFIDAPSGVTLTYSSANSNFDALGRTTATNTITVGSTNIVVENETGYVYSP